MVLPGHMPPARSATAPVKPPRVVEQLRLDQVVGSAAQFCACSAVALRCAGWRQRPRDQLLAAAAAFHLNQHRETARLLRVRRRGGHLPSSILLVGQPAARSAGAVTRVALCRERGHGGGGHDRGHRQHGAGSRADRPMIRASRSSIVRRGRRSRRPRIATTAPPSMRPSRRSGRIVCPAATIRSAIAGSIRPSAARGAGAAGAVPGKERDC